MVKATLPQGTRVRFKTRESQVRPAADPLIEWEGVIASSPLPGYMVVTYNRRDGSSHSSTIHVDDVIETFPAEGKAPTFGSPNPDQTVWERRTAEVHDAAERSFIISQPVRKLGPHQRKKD